MLSDRLIIHKNNIFQMYFKEFFILLYNMKRILFY